MTMFINSLPMLGKNFDVTTPMQRAEKSKHSRKFLTSDFLDTGGNKAFAMTMQEWSDQVSVLLIAFQNLDLGYPTGENVLHSPVGSAGRQELIVRSNLAGFVDLSDFYSVCDGLSWPDIHNGYFVKRLREIGAARPSSEPSHVQGIGDVVTVGSTGGGGLFVMRRDTRSVLLLRSGTLTNGTYITSTDNAQAVAADFQSFCNLLLRDLRAFVKGDSSHRYLS